MTALSSWYGRTADCRHQISADCSRLWEENWGTPCEKGAYELKNVLLTFWFLHLTRKMKIDKIFLNQLRSNSPSSDRRITPISWCLHNINPHTEYKRKLSNLSFFPPPSKNKKQNTSHVCTVLTVTITNCSHFIYRPPRRNKYVLFKTRNKMYYIFWIRIIYLKFNIQYVLFSVSNIVYLMPEHVQYYRNM